MRCTSASCLSHRIVAFFNMLFGSGYFDGYQKEHHKCVMPDYWWVGEMKLPKNGLSSVLQDGISCWGFQKMPRKPIHPRSSFVANYTSGTFIAFGKHKTVWGKLGINSGLNLENGLIMNQLKTRSVREVPAMKFVQSISVKNGSCCSRSSRSHEGGS